MTFVEMAISVILVAVMLVVALKMVGVGCGSWSNVRIVGAISARTPSSRPPTLAGALTMTNGTGDRVCAV